MTPEDPKPVVPVAPVKAVVPTVVPVAPAAAPVAPVKAVAPAVAPIVITGDPVNGGPFNIYGTGFGVVKGTLRIGDRDIPLTKWRDTTVGGDLPRGLSGAIVLTTSDGVKHQGVLKP